MSPRPEGLLVLSGLSWPGLAWGPAGGCRGVRCLAAAAPGGQRRPGDAVADCAGARRRGHG